MNSKRKHPWLSSLLCGCLLFSALTAFSGCQTSIAGVTLPSPNYFQDDVQYFARGPEFKLSREAAALRKARAEAELRNR